jgi:hypothetical protein
MSTSSSDESYERRMAEIAERRTRMGLAAPERGMGARADPKPVKCVWYLYIFFFLRLFYFSRAFFLCIWPIDFEWQTAPPRPRESLANAEFRTCVCAILNPWKPQNGR